ncbi:recombinase family protein [Brevibacillus migulae]|uniref:recombinase family protein n=1 Tax=Brevibacillus migulae TaxID=1644114 RepID=UPI00106ED219|nr:recombinase family protein [Brevibacillus migulae]
MISLPKSVRIHRIISYLRRSREDVEREKRTGEDTIAMQRAVMERVLQEYDLPYDMVIEIGSGDKIRTRPIFQQVLHDLEQEKYNCIAVKEISRLTRGDFRDYGRVYELIRLKRIYILTPYRLYDPLNVNDLRQIRFEMFLSREEFETIRERLQSAKHTYARSGRFMGSTPAYGYRTDQRTQRLLIVPAEAEVVRLIFASYLHGEGGRPLGYRAIAARLTNRGIPSPSGRDGWNPTTIKKILHNPVYIGEIHYRKKEAGETIIVPDAHPAIISPHDFQKVRQKSRPQAPSLRSDHSLHELTGLIRCARCGKKMVRQTTRTSYRKKDGSNSQYEKEMLWCTTPGCTYVKYRAVEQMLLTFLAAIPCPSLADLPLSTRQHEPDQHKALRMRQHSELEKQLSTVYASYESGLYTADEFAKRRTLIQDKLAALAAWSQELEQLQDQKALHAALLARMEHGSKPYHTFAQAYRKLPRPELKNRLLHLLIASVHLERWDKRKGQRITPFSLHIFYRFPDDLPLTT